MSKLESIIASASEFLELVVAATLSLAMGIGVLIVSAAILFEGPVLLWSLLGGQ